MKTFASLLQWLGCGLLFALAGFAALLGAGEALSDPGGLTGVLLVALWAVPMAALLVVAWRWPDLAARVLAALVGLAVLLAAWSSLGASSWDQWENTHGPVRAFVVFVLAGVLAVLGVRRPGPAGVLLLALGFTAVLAQAGTSSAPLAMLALPVLVGGALLLVGALLGRPAPPEVPTPHVHEHPPTGPSGAPPALTA